MKRQQSTAESALSKIEVQEGLITAEVSRAKGEEEKLRSAITVTETNILSTVSKTYTTQEMANKLYANAVQEGQDAADQAEKNAKDDTDTKLKNYSTTVEMNSAINQAADSISLEVSKKSMPQPASLKKMYTDDSKSRTDCGRSGRKRMQKQIQTQSCVNYSTTLEMNSAIKQAADSISLEVSKPIRQQYRWKEKYKDAVKARADGSSPTLKTNATKAGQTAADQAEKNAKSRYRYKAEKLFYDRTNEYSYKTGSRQHHS